MNIKHSAPSPTAQRTHGLRVHTGVHAGRGPLWVGRLASMLGIGGGGSGDYLPGTYTSGVRG